MVKMYVPDQLLVEWFIKSLLPSITEDVAKGGVVIEEKVIAHAQYLELIYSQSGTLYDKIPDAPRPEFSVPPPPKSSKDYHDGNGMIGMTSTKTAKATSKKARMVSSQKADEEPLTSKVNAMSTDKGKNHKQPGDNKKVTNKKKK